MATPGSDGRYEVRDQIGEGPHGTVHRATDLRRRSPVIVKRLDPAKSPPAAVAKFSETAAALRKANVAAVVAPQEVVAQDPGPYIVYPVLEGETLEHALRDGALNWSDAVEIVASLATTLAAVAAASGQSHRALKPTNVWLMPDGSVRVLDYGAADLGPSSPLHRRDLWLEYRAPEQLDGAAGDARSDVFSLAVLLVEATTGVHPFSGTTAYQSAQKLALTPPDLAELVRGMPIAGAREVGKLISQALASEPEDRPADVASFSTMLAFVRPLAGSPAPTRLAPSEPAPPPPKPADPSTLQSLPHLRQLLVQRNIEASTIPVVANPAAASAPAPAAAPADRKSVV